MVIVVTRAHAISRGEEHRARVSDEPREPPRLGLGHDTALGREAVIAPSLVVARRGRPWGPRDDGGRGQGLFKTATRCLIIR